MEVVKYEGDARAVQEKLGTAVLFRNSGGETQMFDSRAREWVTLKGGEYIVNSEDGYYIGSKSGNPKHDEAEGSVQKSAFDTTPSSDPDAAGGVITSGTTK